MNRPLALALALLLALAAVPAALAGPRDRSDRVGAASVAVAGNPVPIPIGEAGASSMEPSTIEVSGLAGGIADLDVTLHSFVHPRANYADVLLVGPRGQTAVLMSDAGGTDPAHGLTLALDDQADAPLPTGIPRPTSGRYAPVNHGDTGDDFPSAPAHDRNARLSVFEGTNPNGTWRLYVVDDEAQAEGKFSGGWGLEIAHGGGSPPKARDDAYRTKEDRTLRRAAPGVLANDAAPDGGGLTARVVAQPTKGSLTLNPDGSFAYKPKRNAHGSDAFTYEVVDGQGRRDTARVTIRVRARPG